MGPDDSMLRRFPGYIRQCGSHPGQPESTAGRSSCIPQAPSSIDNALHTQFVGCKGGLYVLIQDAVLGFTGFSKAMVGCDDHLDCYCMGTYSRKYHWLWACFQDI